MASAPTPAGLVAAPRRLRFVVAYALASAGGVVAYLPLLSLLLPLRMAQVATDALIAYVTLAAILGALAASVANIAFGWASDRSVARGHSRRGWIAGGTVALVPAYAAVALATTPAMLVAGVVAVQVAVNMVLSPLLALMADEVPVSQLGVTSGLLTLGAPLGSGFAALLVLLPVEVMRFAAIPLVAALCIVPFLLTRHRTVDLAQGPAHPPRLVWRDLAIAWIARLLVQIAGVVVALYLLFYFRSLSSAAATSHDAARVALLMTLASLVALPVAIAVGRLSDRSEHRRAILGGSAAVAAGGLLLMALARDWNVGAIGYVVYIVAAGVFLALHAGFAILLLPSARHRGRDLGIVNLTNTVPAVIGPALTWALATTRDFGTVLTVLAILTLMGGVTILAVRRP